MRSDGAAVAKRNSGRASRMTPRGGQHDGENLAHLALPAAGEQADEVRLARLRRFGVLRGQGVDERMPDEHRFQPGRFVERRLERENADHQVEQPRHARDASPVPRPDLRADVIDDLERQPCGGAGRRRGAG